jgi:hypothetical protein
MSGHQPLRRLTLSMSSPTHEEPFDCSCGLAAPMGQARAYNEEAFRYFLEVERKRSARTGCPLLLLLVDLKGKRRSSEAFSEATATSLFSAMLEGVRETDFVGWYHEGSVAGAVLIQRKDASATDATELLRDRILRTIGERLPGPISKRLHVRVFRLPSRRGARTSDRGRNSSL